jgi:LCP family protein required for cell wall assembly
MLKALLERKLSFLFLILQLLLSVGLCGVAIYVGFIPMKYIGVMVAVCVVLLAYQVFSQMADSSYIIGRVLCICFCAIFVGGGYYIHDAYATMSDIGGATTKVDVISFYVLKDDKAETIVDAKDYDFGILSTQDRENTDKSLEEAKKTAGQDLKTVEFVDTSTLVDALYAGEVQAIVFNEAFLNTIEDQYTTFSDDTRKLVEHEIETEVEEEPAYEDTDVTTKSFNVYISGIDVYGKISQTSRSDVNIIATVNPVTKKILLTSTPRDYYVPLYGSKGKSVSGGMPDKLTHAGIYGIDCSINTLEKLYDIDIDYYVRVNFTSVKKIVDILGGVEVYSDYDFISDWGPNGAGTHYKFKKGYNKVNGKKALAFCRERHHFANGDYQRGRDHQHMIEAVLNKVMSPSVLQDFTSLLKETKKMFQTNMSTKKIASLCNMQLNDMATWKISYANAEGTGAKKTTYSIQSTPLYVCEPDYTSVNKITKKIKKIMNQTLEDVENEKTNKKEAQPTLKP